MCYHADAMSDSCGRAYRAIHRVQGLHSHVRGCDRVILRPHVGVEMCACVVHTFGSWGCCMLCVLPWACDVLVAVGEHARLYTELQGLHKAIWGPVAVSCAGVM